MKTLFFSSFAWSRKELDRGSRLLSNNVPRSLLPQPSADSSRFRLDRKLQWSQGRRVGRCGAQQTISRHSSCSGHHSPSRSFPDGGSGILPANASRLVFALAQLSVRRGLLLPSQSSRPLFPSAPCSHSGASPDFPQSVERGAMAGTSILLRLCPSFHLQRQT